MDEERRCGTCIRFDPESGVCEKTAEIMTTQEGKDCGWWDDWEMEFFRKRKDGRNGTGEGRMHPVHDL